MDYVAHIFCNYYDDHTVFFILIMFLVTLTWSNNCTELAFPVASQLLLVWRVIAAFTRLAFHLLGRGLVLAVVVNLVLLCRFFKDLFIYM